MPAAKRSPKAPSKPTKKPAKSKGSNRTDKRKKLAQRIELFCREYVIDRNGARAAKAVGYSERAARQKAYELLQRPDVQEQISALDSEKSAALEQAGLDVLERFSDIAEADPRELIEVHRVCCRYCYGKEHHYQYTPRELDRARAEYEEKRRSNPKPELPPFTAPGGIGYDPRKPPYQDCPECHGFGEPMPLIKDTRSLSPQARRLYAGVKITKDGLQVLMHSQTEALDKLGQNQGLWKRVLQGPKGGPVEVKATLADLLDEIGADGGDTGTGLNR